MSPHVGRSDKENFYGGPIKRNASKVLVPTKSHMQEGKHILGVGDRVSVKMDAKTVCVGEVRFRGPSSGRTVVGIRLDAYRTGLGDGKRSNGERHFRCEVGHAIFASPSQCQLVLRKVKSATRNAGGKLREEPRKKSGVEKVTASAATTVSTTSSEKKTKFDLETALGELVGLESVKDMLRSLRNRLVVGRKRAAFGISDDIARLPPDRRPFTF